MSLTSPLIDQALTLKLRLLSIQFKRERLKPNQKRPRRAHNSNLTARHFQQGV
jgi:hypothetical protein